MSYWKKSLILASLLLPLWSCKDKEEDYLEYVVGNWTGTGISLFTCDDSELNGSYEGCLIPNTDRPRPCLILNITGGGRYTITNNINGDNTSGSLIVDQSTMSLCEGSNCDNAEIATYKISSLSRNKMNFSYTDKYLGCKIRVDLVRIK